MTDSSTGGYLTPATAIPPPPFYDPAFFPVAFDTIPGDAPAPIQDKELYEALQAAVVGITGLPGELVRPRWQPSRV